eukprot:CAMPEP_0116914894 /NCGR_PEP_ID=MMETSP0467-20121206/17599_1 /TAXON_ID=283647 /ORGANISM="Mesodinium pulex, Strain SPMC105" /LENGTH=105 /DNA_ID=CAMNT_0004591443 /DNA_START=152 /DNA_END=469 /DNA_ORIENTATION=-
MIKTNDDNYLKMIQKLIKSFFNIFKIVDSSGNKRVNMFELLIQMILFSKAEKVVKLKFICLLFDFEKRKQIEKEQLLVMVTLFLSGIFKLFTVHTNITENVDVVD